MKRLISLVFVCIMCVSFLTPCFATEFANPPIVDLAEYLSDYEFNELTEKLEAVRQKYDFEVAIVTEEEMSSYSAMSSADDIYDYLDYGAGEGDDGILLYICSGTREYWITTHADGERIFNENGIAYLKNNIEPHLADDDYYGAMDEYIDLADELLAMAAKGAPYDESEQDSSTRTVIIVCALVIPLIVAWIMMASKLALMKTAVENNCAENYIKQGSKQINVSRDIFLYSHVTRTAKPKNNSSHTSSSGRSHGGGGGSF